MLLLQQPRAQLLLLPAPAPRCLCQLGQTQTRLAVPKAGGPEVSPPSQITPIEWVVGERHPPASPAPARGLVPPPAWPAAPASPHPQKHPGGHQMSSSKERQQATLLPTAPTHGGNKLSPHRAEDATWVMSPTCPVTPWCHFLVCHGSIPLPALTGKAGGRGATGGEGWGGLASSSRSRRFSASSTAYTSLERTAPAGWCGGTL